MSSLAGKEQQGAPNLHGSAGKSAALRLMLHLSLFAKHWTFLPAVALDSHRDMAESMLP
jgi:hypothetical protein